MANGPFLDGGDDGGPQGPFVGGSRQAAKRAAKQAAKARARELRGGLESPTTSSSSPARGMGLPTTPWRSMIRRMVVLSIVAIIVAIVQRPLATQRALEGPSTVAPAPAPRTQGRFNVTVESLAGEQVNLSGGGQTLHWRVVRPEVRRVLARSTGERVLVYWRAEDGVTTIVGIVAAAGVVQPA